jgi:hypothetical protein
VKYLLAVSLVALAVAFIYWRLRPYIRAARRLLGVVRDVRGLAADEPPASAPRRPRAAAERLVRCASCGTWLPASRALTLGRPAQNYCTRACLERASVGEGGRAAR